MSTCKVFKVDKAGKEIPSKLYEKLEEQFGDQRYDKPDGTQGELIKDSLWELARSQEFTNTYGNWKILPANEYRLVNKLDTPQESPRLYNLGDDENGQIIYGEPYMADVWSFASGKILATKPWNTSQFKATSSIKVAILRKAASALEKRIKTLSRQKSKELLSGQLKAQKKDLEKELDSIGEAVQDERLLNYAANAMEQTAAILEEMDMLILNMGVAEDEGTKKLTAAAAQDIYYYITAFSDIDSTLAQIQEGKLIVPDKVRMHLQTASDVHKEIAAKYERYAKDYVVNKFSTGGDMMKAWAETSYGKEFAQLNKKYKGDDVMLEQMGIKDKTKEEYIQMRLDEAKTTLEKRGAVIFRNMLEATNQDISFVQRWFLNAQDVNDDVLRALQMEISKVEDEIRLKWIDEVRALHGTFKELQEHQMKKDKNMTREEFYSFMLEKDEIGKPTGYFVSKYHSNWSRDRKKKQDEIYSQEGVSEAAKTRQWIKWKKENIKYNYTLPLRYIIPKGAKKEEKDKIIREATAKRDAKVEALKKEHEAALAASVPKRDAANNITRSGDRGPLSLFEDKIAMIHRASHTQFEIPKKPEDHAKYLNPAYKKLAAYSKLEGGDNIYWKYYIRYMNQNTINDEGLPSNFRTMYKMPSIRKSLPERLEDVHKWMGFFPKLIGKNSLYSEIFQKWKEERTVYVKGEVSERGEESEEMDNLRSKRRKNIQDYASISTDEEGRERQYVPIHYRGQIEIEDLTMDLHGSLVKNTWVTLSYQKMTQLLPYAEMLVFFLQKRLNFTQKAGFKTVGRGSIGRNIDVSAKNSYNAAKDLIEHRMFGVTKLDPGYEIGGLSVTKLLGLVQSYMSTTMLSFNVHSSIANANLANILFTIEGAAGEHFGKKDVAAAYEAYARDMPRMIADLTEPLDQHSKVNVVGLIYDPTNNFDHRQFDYAHNSKTAHLLHGFSLHFLNASVEHHVQSLTMIAYLKSTKILDENDMYLDAKNEPTEDRNKGISLWDSYRIKEGKVVYNHSIRYVEKMIGETTKKMPYYSRDDRAAFHRRGTVAIQRINQQLHGAYSERNAMPFQRLVLGSIMIVFKKYLVPGFRARLGGAAQTVRDYTPKVGKYSKGTLTDGEYIEHSSELPTATPTRMYDPMLGTYRSLGTYSTAYKFIGKVISDLELMKWQVVSANWAELSRNEKGNVIKAVSEIGLALFVLPAAGASMAALAKGQDEDDDFVNWYLGSFMAYRLHSELLQYISPMEAGRILKNPAITITFIERIIDFLSQGKTDTFRALSGEGMEIYKSGSRKGDRKISKKIYDLVPFYKHYTRNRYMKDIVSFYAETGRAR